MFSEFILKLHRLNFYLFVISWIFLGIFNVHAGKSDEETESSSSKKRVEKRKTSADQNQAKRKKTGSSTDSQQAIYGQGGVEEIIGQHVYPQAVMPRNHHEVLQPHPEPRPAQYYQQIHPQQELGQREFAQYPAQYNNHHVPHPYPIQQQHVHQQYQYLMENPTRYEAPPPYQPLPHPAAHGVIPHEYYQAAHAMPYVAPPQAILQQVDRQTPYPPAQATTTTTTTSATSNHVPQAQISRGTEFKAFLTNLVTETVAKALIQAGIQPQENKVMARIENEVPQKKEQEKQHPENKNRLPQNEVLRKAVACLEKRYQQPPNLPAIQQGEQAQRKERQQPQLPHHPYGENYKKNVKWNYNAANARNGEEQHFRIFDEIIAALTCVEVEVSHILMAIEILEQFQMLLRHNVEISAELAESGFNYSVKLYSKRPYDIVFHTEEQFINIEERAWNFYNIIEMIWNKIKTTEEKSENDYKEILISFLKNAFSASDVCLDAKSRRILDWCEKGLDLNEYLKEIAIAMEYPNQRAQDLIFEVYEKLWERTKRIYKPELREYAELRAIFASFTEGQLMVQDLKNRQYFSSAQQKFLLRHLDKIYSDCEEELRQSHYEELISELRRLLEGKKDKEGVIITEAFLRETLQILIVEDDQAPQIQETIEDKGKKPLFKENRD